MGLFDKFFNSQPVVATAIAGKGSKSGKVPVKVGPASSTKIANGVKVIGNSFTYIPDLLVIPVALGLQSIGKAGMIGSALAYMGGVEVGRLARVRSIRVSSNAQHDQAMSLARGIIADHKKAAALNAKSVSVNAPKSSTRRSAARKSTSSKTAKRNASRKK